MNQFHISCSTDENYVATCAAMLASLSENNQQTKWLVHILVSDLQEHYKDRLIKYFEATDNIDIQFYEVNKDRLTGVKYRQNNPLTAAAYYRILLSSILPDSVDRVLYLDCDLLVLGDISDLFRIDLTGYACAAVKDILRITDEHRLQINLPFDKGYFNSGVMMINLDFWRKERCERTLIDFAKRERHVFFHDQDALNYVFKGKWFQLSPQWNRLYPSVYPDSFFHSTEDMDAFEQPKIIHFGGILKPWKNIRWPLGNKYRKMYYCYLKKTGLGDLQLRYTVDRYCCYRELSIYCFHRLFRHYLSAHYVYTKLRKIKHALQR